MFSAHLVFGDIDKHSSMNFPDRVKKLDLFWKICESFKPPSLNRQSFYETDNDTFMAGFSDQAGFYSGTDVLSFVIKLHKTLLENGIPVTFGINLIACGKPLEWKIYDGLINDVKMIYMSDELYEKIGRVQRSRLAGDSLIITARLESLAKKLKKPICFSTFQEGHIDLEGLLKGSANIIEETNNICLLNADHAHWLAEKNIRVYSIEY